MGLIPHQCKGSGPPPLFLKPRTPSPFWTLSYQLLPMVPHTIVSTLMWSSQTPHYLMHLEKWCSNQTKKKKKNNNWNNFAAKDKDYSGIPVWWGVYTEDQCGGWATILMEWCQSSVFSLHIIPIVSKLIFSPLYMYLLKTLGLICLHLSLWSW